MTPEQYEALLARISAELNYQLGRTTYMGMTEQDQASMQGQQDLAEELLSYIQQARSEANANQ